MRQEEHSFAPSTIAKPHVSVGKYWPGEYLKGRPARVQYLKLKFLTKKGIKIFKVIKNNKRISSRPHYIGSKILLTLCLLE